MGPISGDVYHMGIYRCNIWWDSNQVCSNPFSVNDSHKGRTLFGPDSYIDPIWNTWKSVRKYLWFCLHAYTPPYWHCLTCSRVHNDPCFGSIILVISRLLHFYHFGGPMRVFTCQCIWTQNKIQTGLSNQMNKRQWFYSERSYCSTFATRWCPLVGLTSIADTSIS